MSKPNEPNVVIPLAASYNVRGVDGFTATYTNSLDARKINCIYELVTNSVTGNATLSIAKRPGVSLASSSYGTSGQVGYLVCTRPSATQPRDVWVFSVSGNDVRVSDTSTTTVIVTAAGYAPVYVDTTLISGVPTVVLTIRNSGNTYRNFYASDIASWTEITDADFPPNPRGKPEHLDGYMHQLDIRSRIYSSDVNSVSSWSASSFITKQIKQDIPTGLARFGKQLLAFGVDTIEVFRTSGTATGSPLATVPDLMQNIGAVPLSLGATGGHYYAMCDGKLYFAGAEATTLRNYGIYAYNGSAVEKASTPSIDKIINGFLSLDDTNNGIFSVHPMSFYGQKGVAFALDMVTATTQRWLMFFPQLKEWFEWNSTVFTPRGNGAMYLGVGSNQHKVYSFPQAPTIDNWQDAGTSYAFSVQFKLPSDGNHRKFMSMCDVLGDIARNATLLSVEFSDDDGQTWQTARTIDMTLAGGKALTRCGSFFTRHIRLSYTGAQPIRLQKLLARVM